MRRRVENDKMACGRMKEDYFKSCRNPDYTWKSNRLVFTGIKFFWHRNKPVIHIHYEIVCRKCGHTRQSGNCFGLPVIKELITGKICF